MILDLEKGDGSGGVPDKLECDVLIVGAGAVGLIMAAELSRKGVDVIVLEGGGQGIETASQDLNDAVLSGRNLTGLHNARFRMMGGSTNFWGGQIVRFDPIIFEPRPWIDSAGWPIKRADLDRFYDASARLCGLADDFSDADLWARVGNQPLPLGDGLDVFLTRCLLNRSTAHMFKADLDGPKLRTVIHANVTQLIADPGDSGQIVGVVARSLKGREVRVSGRRVVLTCGTIEIARLLLHDIDGATPAPWHANPWLGRGFIDHIEAVAGSVTLRDKHRFHQTFDNLFVDKIKYLPRIKLSAERQREDQIMEVAGRFEFRSVYKEDLANLKLFVRSLMNGRRPDNLSQLPAHIAAVWKVAIPLAVRYLKSRRGFNPTDGGIDLVLMSEQLPIKTSRIALTSERNALGMHKLDVNWAIDGRELESMARFAEISRDAFAASGTAEIAVNERLLARDPAFLDDALDYYHQMGGARIGASAAEGVVDANLRVHGTRNLYVAGAAVFPSSGFGNPTYTAMALGVRLCAHLMGSAA